MENISGIRILPSSSHKRDRYAQKSPPHGKALYAKRVQTRPLPMDFIGVAQQIDHIFFAQFQQ